MNIKIIYLNGYHWIAKNPGVVITIIWIIVWMVIIAFSDKKFNKLELNEIGDFMAGVFAPLALLWVVLGYFQQGKEL